ncbi:DUF4153 domain-containing protein [Dyadobacter pollutisoli]|uniref:DUF4153 domain-containing protein n=1 Tax=Dyadobacter pollutisoli TaxID=2910158 RepID=A0A9E8N7C0_9BACT|nr:DUF4153 domain-containing protein [Dyadobacter pollutisoli]WAC11209.1 DUF4153 domain-containing protein [Dyadobacter pollutisoli]
MIKLPSVQSLTESFVQTTTRYKWVVAVALIKMAVLLRYTETPNAIESERNFLLRLGYVSFLALPLFLAVLLSAKRRQWKNSWTAGIMVGITGLLVWYYFSLPDDPGQTDYYRFMLFMAGAHLIVSFAPFIGFDEPNGFWQFNKTLFLQFLNASLYSLTLFIGLLIAIQAIKYLFKVELSAQIEMDLAVVIFTFFHTVFFLSKIPDNLGDLERQTKYPNGLKIFTQYVLLPLEVVYVIILYAYTGKIIFQWKLPEGGVAYLVLAFSIAGIFALLLLYPLRKNQEERWIQIFSRRYYLALLPLIVLLFIGITRRIGDYGVTENRYIIAVLAIWLAGITFYFLSGKRDDIRWIPISLSILCFLLPIGPWNIFAVSKTSQLNQFHTILAEHKILNAKNQITGKATMKSEDYERLTSIVSFFRYREETGLEPHFAGFSANDRKEYEYYRKMDAALEKHIRISNPGSANNYAHFSSQLSRSAGQDIAILGFNKMVFFDSADDEQIKNKEWRFLSQNKRIAVYRNNIKVTELPAEKKVSELIDEFSNNSMSVPQEKLVFGYQDAHNHIKVIIRSISKNDTTYSAQGILLYK